MSRERVNILPLISIHPSIHLSIRHASVVPFTRFHQNRPDAMCRLRGRRITVLNLEQRMEVSWYSHIKIRKLKVNVNLKEQ